MYKVEEEHKRIIVEVVVLMINQCLFEIGGLFSACADSSYVVTILNVFSVELLVLVVPSVVNS